MLDPGMDTRPMEPNEDGIDRVLRRSMAAPIPSLPPDFDQRLMRKAGRDSQVFYRYRRILFTGYGLVSLSVSAVVMRGQGLDWSVVSETMLAPLALVAIAGLAWRAAHTTMRHGTGKT